MAKSGQHRGTTVPSIVMCSSHLSVAAVHPILQSPTLTTDSSYLFYGWSNSPGCKETSAAFYNVSSNPCCLYLLGHFLKCTSNHDERLVSHFLWTMSFSNILWQVSRVKIAYQATSYSTQIFQNTHNCKGTPTETALAWPNRSRKRNIWFVTILYFFLKNYIFLLFTLFFLVS